MKSFLKVAGVLLGVLVAQSAHALTIGFYQLTSNGGAAGVAGQLAVDTTDNGTGFSLKFTNTGVIASNIASIYATNGKTFGALTITDSGAGVDFAAGGDPGNLPGSNNALGGLASATSPAPHNGVNAASEWVTLSFLYGGSFANFASLTSQLGAGSLQFGVHVTAYANGASESFVTGGSVGEFPPPNTPGVPDSGAAVLLFGGVLVALGLLKRRLG